MKESVAPCHMKSGSFQTAQMVRFSTVTFLNTHHFMIGLVGHVVDILKRVYHIYIMSC